MSIKKIEKIEEELKHIYKAIDDIAFFNFGRVLAAFKKHRVAPRHFSGSTGYGYGDDGRDTLGKVFADAFMAEAALVSPLLASGTHTISTVLFGLLRPNHILLSISGDPYDTLRPVIWRQGIGSLKDFCIDYDKVELRDSKFDMQAIKDMLTKYKGKSKVVFIQRSKGYSWRNTLSIDQISEACELVKQLDPATVIIVDNCYGEFTMRQEPTEVGADIIMGSLIKNPGGGIAPTGGYIAGKKHLIDKIANKLTAPGIAAEVGSCISGYLPYYQGLYFAPTVTAAALKGSVLMAALFSKLGYKTLPDMNCFEYGDIITSIEFGDRERLLEFMKIIQKVSPVDSHVSPEPWDMPGYQDKVVMAAGCFVAGSSIELSADAPMRPPYIAYLQGGLTYEHVKTAAVYLSEKFVAQ